MRFLWIVIFFTWPIYAQGNTLQIASSAYAPFVDSDGEGIAADIIRAAYKSVSVDSKFLIFPFARSVHSFSRGESKVGFFDETTLAAKSTKEFQCVPFFAYEAVLFSKAKIETKSGKKLSVGLLRGNPFEEKLLRSQGLRLNPVNTLEAMIKLLHLNRVDLISTVKLTGYSVIRRILPTEEWEAFQVHAKPYYRGKAGLCYGKGMEKLRNQFIQGLKKLRSSGEFERLAKRGLKKHLIGDLDSYYKTYWHNVK